MINFLRYQKKSVKVDFYNVVDRILQFCSIEGPDPVFSCCKDLI